MVCKRCNRVDGPVVNYPKLNLKRKLLLKTADKNRMSIWVTNARGTLFVFKDITNIIDKVVGDNINSCQWGELQQIKRIETPEGGWDENKGNKSEILTENNQYKMSNVVNKSPFLKTATTRSVKRGGDMAKLESGINDLNLSVKVPTPKLDPKHKAGEKARKQWSKPIVKEALTVTEFNNVSKDTQFVKRADILLDSSDARQTVIQANPVDEQADKWCANEESIYTFVRNGKIMKIGGTRASMKERFGSYLCGHHVSERGKSDKMSVTNAYIYHTIETDLLEDDDSKWEIYTFSIPHHEITVPFMGKDICIKAQVYHGLESHAIEVYKNLAGSKPQFSFNSDPSYHKNINKMNVTELIYECESAGLDPYQSINVKSGPNKGNARPKLKKELKRMLTEIKNI